MTMQRAKSETQLNEIIKAYAARPKEHHFQREDLQFMVSKWKMFDIHHIRDSVLGIVYAGTMPDPSESDPTKRKRVVAKRSDILTAEQRHRHTFDDPERDAKILTQLNAMNENKGHPHIIRLVDFVVEKERQLLWTVTEYGGKDMYEVIHSLVYTPTQALTESIAKSIARQLGTTLLQLHKWGLAHLDIGCENILLEPKGDDDKKSEWHARFCDFGMAYHCAVIDKNGAPQWQDVYDRFGGKRACMSPEQVIHAERHLAHAKKKSQKTNAALAATASEDVSMEEYKKKKQKADQKHLAELKATAYDARAADVFAWGSLVFQMVCGCPPFEVACPDSCPDYRAILNGKLAWVVKSWKCQTLSPECMDFMQQILTAPPEKRIDIAAWLTHPWFN